MSSIVHVALGKVAKLNPTLNTASVLADEPVDFLPMSAVMAEHPTAQATETRKLNEVQQGYTNFADGDVLLAKITPCFENGKIAQIRLKHRYGFGSTEFHVLRADANRLDGRYLVHFLRRDQIRVDGERRMTGSAGQRRVPKHFLESLLIPLPPLPEQRRIAAILDQADALRAKRREALAQLDSLTQSIFIEMFGDPRKNAKGWPLKPIGSFISDMKGGAPLEPGDFIDSGFPILHKRAIKRQGKIRLDARKKTFVTNEYALARPRCIANREFVAVTLRDLVPSGPSIGLAADLHDGPFDEYILAQGAYAFRIDPAVVTPEFFVQLSNMPTFRYVLLQNAVGSTQIHIRTPIYLAIKSPIPPIKLQHEFSRRVRALIMLKSKSADSLSELDTLFSSLQHRAFRGEL